MVSREFNEILNEYTKKFIAIRNQRIVDNDNNSRQLLERLKEKYNDPSRLTNLLRDYFCHSVRSNSLICIQFLRIFVTQTANNFPEFLYTLIFQIKYKILVHYSNVYMYNVFCANKRGNR